MNEFTRQTVPLPKDVRMVRCALLGLLLSSSPGVTAEYPWEEQPASRWLRDFSNSPRDNRLSHR